jgi:hypothetical protein
MEDMPRGGRSGAEGVLVYAALSGVAGSLCAGLKGGHAMCRWRDWLVGEAAMARAPLRSAVALAVTQRGFMCRLGGWPERHEGDKEHSAGPDALGGWAVLWRRTLRGGASVGPGPECHCPALSGARAGVGVAATRRSARPDTERLAGRSRCGRSTSRSSCWTHTLPLRRGSSAPVQHMAADPDTQTSCEHGSGLKRQDTWRAPVQLSCTNAYVRDPAGAIQLIVRCRSFQRT